MKTSTELLQNATVGPFSYQRGSGELGRSQVFGRPHADGSNYAAICTLAKDADAELIARLLNFAHAGGIDLLEAAIKRIELHVNEGGHELSAWLPDAKEAFAILNGKTTT